MIEQNSNNLKQVRDSKKDIKIMIDKNSKTKMLATYILIFFAIILLVLGGYFIYNLFFKQNANINFSYLIDPDFNSIFVDIKKEENKEEDKKYEEIKVPDCVYNEKTFKHGDQVVMYSREFVDPYDSCEYYKTVRICSAGLLAGEERFRYFTCQRTVDCITGDNGVIKNGNYVELYSKVLVPFGDKCNRYKGQVRCADGQLIGDNKFKYKNCAISLTGTCKIDGETLGDSHSHIFYKKRVVDLEEICSDFSLRRYCYSGHLQGDKDYKYWSCTKDEVKNCFLSGVEIPHGSSDVFYSKKHPENGKTCDFFADIRECYNGTLSGLEEYSYPSCD